MNKRLILPAVFLLSLLIPGLYLLHLESVFTNGSTQDEVAKAISGYRLRIWISWTIMILIAIQNKWTTGNNTFFRILYFLLIMLFGMEGIYVQRMVNSFGIATNFQDSYSYGVLITVVNIVMAAGMTAFIQLMVWWFTRKLHRR